MMLHQYLIGFNEQGRAEAGTTQVDLEQLPGLNTIMFPVTKLEALCGKEYLQEVHHLRLVDGELVYEPIEDDEDEKQGENS